MEQRELKTQLLHTSVEMIESLAVRIEQAVTLYHGGKDVEGSQKIIPVIEDLQQLIEAIVLTADVQVQPISVGELQQFGEEIVTAFENQDFVLLADLFEYEVTPILEQWKEQIMMSLGD